MQKPRLNFWQIWNMSFGFLGIQFGWGLQMANMSAIYSYLGANADTLAYLWLAAPVTGVLIQPLVGQSSDRIWTRLGRRRPFILGGAILASIALVLMPNCPSVWMAAGLLWVLDGTINASMQPFRALVADNLPDEQTSQGFAIQSLFIGLGGTIGSALPWMMTNWFGVAPEGAGQGHIPSSVRLAFYIGAAAFLGAVLWTVFKTKEYPPSETELAAIRVRKFDWTLGFMGNNPEQFKPVVSEGMSEGMIFGILNIIFAFCVLIGSAVSLGLTPSGEYSNETYAVLTICGATLLVSGIGLCLKLNWARALAIAYNYVFILIALLSVVFLPKSIGLVAVLFGIHGIIYSIIQLFFMSKEPGILALVFHLPRRMWELGLVQFFTWIGMFSLWVYFSPAVAKNIFHAAPGSVGMEASGSWSGNCFAAYNIVCFFFSFVLLWATKYTGPKLMHVLCLAVGALGLATVPLAPDKYYLLISMTGVGIAWASILSMPYAMLAPSLPKEKIGVLMGMFNLFIVLPQIVASSLLGWILKTCLHDEPMNALVLGGASMGLAALLTWLVVTFKQTGEETLPAGSGSGH